MKIVMLVGKGESSKIVYNSLSINFHIDMVIEESPVPITLFLKRRLGKFGYFKVMGQVFFMMFNYVLYFVSRRRIQEIKNHFGLVCEHYPKEVLKKVSSVNSLETIEIIKNISPDIIIVNGTRIISKNVLETLNATILNIHVGITPKYRGVHGGYWSLVNGDKDNCGVTVHLVDSGIDTGGILYQTGIEITPKDNFNTYPYLQIAKALPLLSQTIVDITNNQLIEKQVNTESNLYTHPTLYQYLINRVKGVK